MTTLEKLLVCVKKCSTCITTIIEVETKLVQRKKVTYFAGRKLVMLFLKNLFFSDFRKKNRRTIMNFAQDTGQEDMNTILLYMDLQE